MSDTEPSIKDIPSCMPVLKPSLILRPYSRITWEGERMDRASLILFFTVSAISPAISLTFSIRPLIPSIKP
ncbi:MAG: hypothetical protein BWY65_01664 [Firmicutes bacterium ADurb.Bin373]|nr:MAG: hypothetical protein BWY65_01664 [Firmicutes bacterium ADurb.Bin373]